MAHICVRSLVSPTSHKHHSSEGHPGAPTPITKLNSNKSNTILQQILFDTLAEYLCKICFGTHPLKEENAGRMSQITLAASTT